MKYRVLIFLMGAAAFVGGCDKSGSASSKVTRDGTADISVTEELDSYRHNTGSPDNTFDMYEMRSRYSINTEVNGRRDSHPSTDTNPPKADKGEYHKITLTPGDGKLGSVKEDQGYFSKSINKLRETSNQYEIQLTDGTWDDYRQGKDVKFVASPKGIEQIKAHMTELFKSMLGEFAKAALVKDLEASGVKDISLNADIQEIQISNDPATANLNTVKFHDTGLTRMTIKVHAQGTKSAR